MGDNKVFTGDTEEEALENASSALDQDIEDVSYTVVSTDEDGVVTIEAWIDTDVAPIDDSDSEIEEDEEESEEESSEEPEVEDEDSEDEEEFTDEDLDNVADVAIENIKKILSHFDVEEASIDEYEGDEGEIILDIVGGNLAPLIGRHGKNLDALQLLVTSMTYKELGFRYPVTIDIEGYKNRRREKLESIAKSSAARAVRQGNDVKMRPMTAYERRIIHMCLKNDDRVETVSEGTEPNRCVVIRLL